MQCRRQCVRSEHKSALIRTTLYRYNWPNKLLDSKRNFAYIIAKEYYEKEEATLENRIPSDTILVREARRAVSAELKKKRALNKPIAEFDSKAKKGLFGL